MHYLIFRYSCTLKLFLTFGPTRLKEEGMRIKFVEISKLINLLDGWSCTGSSTWSTASTSTHIRHTTWGTGHTSRHTTSGLVQLCDDGVAHTFNLLLFVAELFNLSKLVSIQPLDSFITLVIDLLSVIFRDFVLKLFILDGSLHVEAVALKTILSRDPILLLLVISLELFSI